MMRSVAAALCGLALWLGLRGVLTGTAAADQASLSGAEAVEG